MSIQNKKSLILMVGLLGSCGVTLADNTNGPNPYAAGYGFDTPSEAAWGGWARGATGTMYAEWDTFTDSSYGTASDRTAAPTLGSFGTTSAYLGWNPGTFVAGSGNLYSFSVVENFQINLTGTTTSAPLRVALQTEEWGTPINTGSVLLNGIAPTFSGVTFTNPNYNSSFGAVTLTQRLFYWDLASVPSNFQLAFNSAEHSMSLAQVAVDIGAAPVPLPPAAWLFVSALTSLGIIQRRGGDRLWRI